MKTFLVLFVIAVSLPVEAQQVRENVKQRVEITESVLAGEEAAPVVEANAVDKSAKKNQGQNAVNAKRKQ
jgi:hypothetical protein